MPRLQPGQIPFAEMDSRQSAKWCKEQILAADDNSVGTAELQDNAVTTPKILNNAVTLAKFQSMTADRILGRLGTNGTLEQLTASQVTSLLQAVAWAFDSTVSVSGTTTLGDVSITGDTEFSGDVGFFTASPVAQQSSSVVVVNTTISGTGDDANINSNFSALANAVNTLRTALLNLGLTA